MTLARASTTRGDDLKKAFDLFRGQAVVRTLFALGRSAEYRYYETAEEGSVEDGGDYVKMTYAVTCVDGHKGKTDVLYHYGHEPQDRSPNRAAATGRSAASTVPKGRRDGNAPDTGWYRKM